jgi:hypothetical protein
MITKQSNSTFRFTTFFAKRERLPNQGGTSLAQGMLASLDMGGFAGIFPDWSETFRGADIRGTLPIIPVQEGTLPVIRREGRPHRAARRLGSVAKGEPHHPAGLTFEGGPDPDLRRLGTDIRPACIQFEDRALG